MSTDFFLFIFFTVSISLGFFFDFLQRSENTDESPLLTFFKHCLIWHKTTTIRHPVADQTHLQQPMGLTCKALAYCRCINRYMLSIGRVAKGHNSETLTGTYTHNAMLLRAQLLSTGQAIKLLWVNCNQPKMIVEKQSKL